MKRVLVVMAVVLSSGNLLAQAEAQQQQTGRKQTIVFGEGDALIGHRDGPEGEIVKVTRRAKFGNLIKVRANFRDCLLESTAGL